MSVVPDAPASGRSLHQDPGLMTKVMMRSMREMRSISFLVMLPLHVNEVVDFVSDASASGRNLQKDPGLMTKVDSTNSMIKGGFWSDGQHEGGSLAAPTQQGV